MLKLIIGLGNPGGDYEATYHNVGRRALAHIVRELEARGEAAALQFKTHKNLFRYAVTAGGIALVEPLTFMNESGAAAKAALRTFGGRAVEMAILHDDSDLIIGAYKLSSGQRAAGHKGVQSVMDAVRSNAFMRARIGIRPAKEKTRKKASEFVLAKIAPKDAKILDGVFDEIAHALLP